MKARFLFPKLVLVLMTTSSLLSGQTPLNVVSALDSVVQQNAFSIIELEDGTTYVSGQILLRGSADRGVFTAAYDDHFNSRGYSVLQDTANYQAFSNGANELVDFDGCLYKAHTDDIFRSVQFDSFTYAFTSKYIIETGKFEYLHTVKDTLDSNSYLLSRSLILNRNNELVHLCRSRSNDIIGITINPSSGAVIKQFRISDAEYRYWPMKLIEISNGYLIFGGSLSIDDDNIQFIIKLDEAYSIVDRFYQTNNYFDPHQQAFVDSDGYIILPNSEHQGDFDNWRSIVTKMDENLNEIWTTTIGDTTFSRDLSYYTAGVETHDMDGYILCGIDTEEDSIGTSRGQIARIDKDGELIWHRRYLPVDTNFQRRAELFSMVISHDGNYKLCGRLANASDNIAIDSIVNAIWLLEIDDDGHIVIDDDTDVIDIGPSSSIRIFPNPTSDYIYIEHDEAKGYSYEIYDSQARQVLQKKETEAWHTYMLPLSNHPSGLYYLHIIDQQGTRIVKEIVIQR